MRPKKDLRQEVRTRLKAQRGAWRKKRSELIADKLFGLPAFRHARFVCFYVSLPYEVDTGPMIDRSLAEGKRVLVPLCDRKQKKLFLYEIRNRKRDLKKGSFGIGEPDPRKTDLANLLDVDCVIVPGIVFDRENHRVGHGAGFYDRFLDRLGPAVPKIGLAFSFQVVEKVPREKHDEKVDFILTDGN